MLESPADMQSGQGFDSASGGMAEVALERWLDRLSCNLATDESLCGIP
jgi:hypothetical protein